MDVKLDLLLSGSCRDVDYIDRMGVVDCVSNRLSPKYYRPAF